MTVIVPTVVLQAETAETPVAQDHDSTAVTKSPVSSATKPTVAPVKSASEMDEDELLALTDDEDAADKPAAELPIKPVADTTNNEDGVSGHASEDGDDGDDGDHSDEINLFASSSEDSDDSDDDSANEGRFKSSTARSERVATGGGHGPTAVSFSQLGTATAAVAVDVALDDIRTSVSASSGRYGEQRNDFQRNGADRRGRGRGGGGGGGMDSYRSHGRDQRSAFPHHRSGSGNGGPSSRSDARSRHEENAAAARGRSREAERKRPAADPLDAEERRNSKQRSSNGNNGTSSSSSGRRDHRKHGGGKCVIFVLFY